MMRKLLINIAFISTAALTGCSAENRISMPDISLPDMKIPGVYRIPVQQGNLITQEMVNDLKPGMTKRQVRYLLGTPLLVDTFHEDRWDYLYTFNPGGNLGSLAATEQKQLKIYFENGRLHRLVGDIYPQGEVLAKATKEANRERTVVVPVDAPRPGGKDGFFERIVKKVTGDDNTPQKPAAEETEPKSEGAEK